MTLRDKVNIKRDRLRTAYKDDGKRFNLLEIIMVELEKVGHSTSKFTISKVLNLEGKPTSTRLAPAIFDTFNVLLKEHQIEELNYERDFAQHFQR